MQTILLVEDEEPIRRMIEFSLSRAGFKIIEAGNAHQAQSQLKSTKPDLILMDWMLPDTTGVQLVRKIKRDGLTNTIPVIMLTAKTTEDDKITGLDSGADDYITKPFSPKELTARVKAVLRRNGFDNTDDEILIAQELRLDMGSHRVTAKGTTIDLSPTEFRLLSFLMRNPNRVYSRQSLLDQVWGRNKYVEERTVDVHILRLRKELSPWGYDYLIHTLRSVGYRFSPN